jgi:hypothetical protein
MSFTCAGFPVRCNTDRCGEPLVYLVHRKDAVLRRSVKF